MAISIIHLLVIPFKKESATGVCNSPVLFLKKTFSYKITMPGFYLQGDVGVGKTMILNFFYENFNLSKTLLNIQLVISENDFLFKKNELVNPIIHTGIF